MYIKMSDPFSNDEKTNLLFKKFMGKPSTVNTRSFFEEPNRPTRSVVISDQVWIDNVPSEAPSELASLGDADLDDNGYVLAGSLAGKTSNDGIIKRYLKVPLTMVIGTGGKAYEGMLSTNSHPNEDSGGIPTTGATGSFDRVTQDIIPFNYDPAGSYLYNLYRNNGTEISFGAGEWIIDSANGIVTFYEYDDISSDVTEVDPPLLSFYRYVGSKGFDTIRTGVTIFDSGNTASEDDDLAAIQVSTVSPIGSSGYTDAMQFADTADGAFRITVNRGTTQELSSLIIQKRIDGIWYNKAKFT
jgi:hypothetical protein